MKPLIHQIFVNGVLECLLIKLLFSDTKSDSLMSKHSDGTTTPSYRGLTRVSSPLAKPPTAYAPESPACVPHRIPALSGACPSCDHGKYLPYVASCGRPAEQNRDRILGDIPALRCHFPAMLLGRYRRWVYRPSGPVAHECSAGRKQLTAPSY